MSVLFAMLLLIISVWGILALFFRLRRQDVSAAWWATLAVLMVCGMALGVWCALYCEYPVGTKYRVGSFPIPVVIFHMEEGNWVDFPLDTFFAWGVMAAAADGANQKQNWRFKRGSVCGTHPATRNKE
jgi:hypothetical protein